MGCPNACPADARSEANKPDEKISEETGEQNSPYLKKFVIISAVVFIAAFAIVFFGVRWIYPHTLRTTTLEYNGFLFQKSGGLWHTTWVNNGQPYQVTLRYNPEEVEEIPVFGGITEAFNQHDIYLAFDPTADTSEFKYTALANAELSLSLAKAFRKNPIAACIKNETEPCENRPIATCEDSNKSVIIVAANGDPAVLMKENCIILKGNEMDILKSADKLLYTWYKIMHPIPIPLEEFIKQATSANII